jgi:UDP-GlcNAc3NAcA epimerase
MPEEFNRIETDRLADLLLAPTAVAVENLKNEGLLSGEARIRQCGDVMYDAVMYYGALPETKPQVNHDKDFLLCTIHRAENTDNREKLSQLVAALNALSDKYQIVFPIHPRTEKRMQSFGLRLSFPTHPPQTYLQIINLLKNCALVLTDSGGLQKEAYFLKKFCITLRNETEWVELVNAGYNQLAGTSPTAILNAVENALEKKGSFNEAFYGDGHAAECIVSALKEC